MNGLYCHLCGEECHYAASFAAFLFLFYRVCVIMDGMAKGVIDLRNRAKIISDEDSTRQKDIVAVTNSTSADTEIQWQAKEYEAKGRSAGWFLVAGGGATLVTIGSILLQNYFFALFVVIAFLVYVMLEKRTPRTISCAVSQEGIRVGSSVHKFSHLKSFWVFEELHPPELSLETTQPLTPFVRVPLASIFPDRIRVFLKNFLPEEKHQEFLTDHIARNL